MITWTPVERHDNVSGKRHDNVCGRGGRTSAAPTASPVIWRVLERTGTGLLLLARCISADVCLIGGALYLSPHPASRSK
jgi:hypothetical protein